MAGASTVGRRGALAGAAGLAAGLAGHARAQRPAKLTYGGSAWLGHYPAWVAIKTGLMAKHGVELAWANFGTSSARMGALLAGQIDVAGTGAVSAMALMAQGSRAFQVIGAPCSFGRVQGLLVRDGVGAVRDLRGKRIGVTFASSGHVMLLDLLAQNGMDPERDVQLINLPAPDVPQAYQTGQVDAAVAWTPQFNRIRDLPGTRVLATDEDFSLNRSHGVNSGPDLLVARTAAAERQPDAVRGFLRAVFEANAVLIERPDEAARVLTELTNLPQAEQLATVREAVWFTLDRQRAMLVQPGDYVGGLQRLADMLVALRQLDRAPRVADWVQARFL